MPRIVCNKAKLVCSCGSNQGGIRADRSNYRIEGSDIIVDTDSKPIINLGDFGVCKITGSQCIPVTQLWSNCSHVEIEDRAIVVANSSLTCSIGGTITVADPGQSSLDG